jgi:threonine dehydratase
VGSRRQDGPGHRHPGLSPSGGVREQSACGGSAALNVPRVATEPIPLREIEEARRRIGGFAIRTPLVRLGTDEGAPEVWLKLENLQPIGSFKIRGAANAMTQADPDRLDAGVYTASAGNMAQGVAYVARSLGVPCAVVVPDTAPTAKLEAIDRLGAEIVKIPFDEWWEVFETHEYGPFIGRLFVHPFADPAVMAGNGTIGLEIAEDLPDADSVVVPYGGGGLSCGIASALRAVHPKARVFASEIDTAAPLAAAFEVGEPVPVPYVATFVDGIGAKGLVKEMWGLARVLLAGSLPVSLEEAARAIRLMVERNHVVAEGAGATSVAAALSGRAGGGKVVCVVSGGNIDPNKIAAILSGTVP